MQNVYTSIKSKLKPSEFGKRPGIKIFKKKKWIVNKTSQTLIVSSTMEEGKEARNDKNLSTANPEGHKEHQTFTDYLPEVECNQECHDLNTLCVPPLFLATSYLQISQAFSSFKSRSVCVWECVY